MSGEALALGAIGALALAGVARRHGSRADLAFPIFVTRRSSPTQGTWWQVPAALLGRLDDALLEHLHDRAAGEYGWLIVAMNDSKTGARILGLGTQRLSPLASGVRTVTLPGRAELRGKVRSWLMSDGQSFEVHSVLDISEFHPAEAIRRISDPRGGSPTRTRSFRLSRPTSLDYDVLARRLVAFVRRRWEAEGLFDEDLRRWAARQGLTFLGLGSHRAVFATPEGALKLLLDRDFAMSNLNEMQVWDEAPSDLRPYLVPVLAAAEDGSWLLMERVRVAKHDVLPAKIGARFERCGITDLRGGSNLSEDGRVLDYGYLYDTRAWRRCVEAGRSGP